MEGYNDSHSFGLGNSYSPLTSRLSSPDLPQVFTPMADALRRHTQADYSWSPVQQPRASPSRTSQNHNRFSSEPSVPHSVPSGLSMLSTELEDNETSRSLISEGLGSLDDSGGLPSFPGFENAHDESISGSEGERDGNAAGPAANDDLSRVCDMLMRLFASRSCNSTPRTTATPASATGAGPGITPADLKVARRRTEGVMLSNRQAPAQQGNPVKSSGREASDIWRRLPQLKMRSSQHHAGARAEGEQGQQSQQELTTLFQANVLEVHPRLSAGVPEKQGLANLLDTTLARATSQPDDTKWKLLGEGLETLLSCMEGRQNEESVNYLVHWLQQVTEGQESASIQASDLTESGESDSRARFLQRLDTMVGNAAAEMDNDSSYCAPADLVGSFGEVSDGLSTLNGSGLELHSSGSNSSDGLGRLGCVSGAASHAQWRSNPGTNGGDGGAEWVPSGVATKGKSSASVPGKLSGGGRRGGDEDDDTGDSSGSETKQGNSDSEEDFRCYDDNEAPPAGLRAYTGAWNSVHNVNWLATRRTTEDSFFGNRSSGRNSSERTSAFRKTVGRSASGTRRSAADVREEGRKRSSSTSMAGEKRSGERSVNPPSSARTSGPDVQQSLKVVGFVSVTELQAENGPPHSMPKQQLLSQDRSMSLSSFLSDLSPSDAGLPEFALSPLQASPATSSQNSRPQSENGSPRPPCSDDDLPLPPPRLRESSKWGNLQHSLGYDADIAGDGASGGVDSSAQVPIMPPPPSTLLPPSLAASLTASPQPWSSYDSSAVPMPLSSGMAFSASLPSPFSGLHQPESSLLSHSSLSASSDSEPDLPIHLYQTASALDSVQSFSDPDVPIPKLQSQDPSSHSSHIGASNSGPAKSEEAAVGSSSADLMPALDYGNDVGTGTSDHPRHAGGAMGAGSYGDDVHGNDMTTRSSGHAGGAMSSESYGDAAGSSRGSMAETAGVGLLAEGGITWDEVDGSRSLSTQVSGMVDFSENSSVAGEEEEQLVDGADNKTERVDKLAAGLVSEGVFSGGSGSAAGHSGGVLEAQAMEFEVIKPRGVSELAADEATPRLSAVLQVLQSARQKIRAVTVPSPLQPSPAAAATLDFQETVKSDFLPMPRKSPLGDSSITAHLPTHPPAGAEIPSVPTQSLMPVTTEQPTTTGERSQPGVQPSSTHTASKLRQPMASSRNHRRDPLGQPGSSSVVKQERAEAEAANDPVVAAGSKAASSVSALREVVHARREKQAGASSKRESSAAGNKKAAASTGAGAGVSAVAGAAVSLDAAYYKEKGSESGSASDRSRSSRSRRPGGGSGGGGRSSKSKEKQGAKDKGSSGMVDWNPDVFSAEEADGGNVPLRRSRHPKSHQQSPSSMSSQQSPSSMSSQGQQHAELMRPSPLKPSRQVGSSRK